MLLRLVFLSSLTALSACNPAKEQVTLGPPATKALKTTELGQDARQRITLLAAQTDLTKNSLFSNYQMRTTSQWSKGWTRRVDMTGVCWSHRQAGTAITPRHLVCAAHFPVKVGASIVFHDRSGKAHSRKVVKRISFQNRKDEARADITVALLAKPLPPAIKTYRLLPPRSDYEYALLDNPVLVSEQNRRLFIHKIRRVSRLGITFAKNPDVPESLYKPLIKGDSGHPSFLLVGGEPVLIETHTGGGSGSGPFYSSPLIFAALEETVAALDPSYKIKTVPLNPQLAPAPPEKTKAERHPPGKVRKAPVQKQPGKSKKAPQLPRVRRAPAPKKG